MDIDAGPYVGDGVGSSVGAIKNVGVGARVKACASAILQVALTTNAATAIAWLSIPIRGMLVNKRRSREEILARGKLVPVLDPSQPGCALDDFAYRH
jgi:hypothetical protein